MSGSTDDLNDGASSPPLPAAVDGEPIDLIDRLLGASADSPVARLRHARAEVRAATQGSFDALFDSADGIDLSPLERELAALRVAALQFDVALAGFHRRRARRLGADDELLESVEQRPAHSSDGDRLASLLAFVDLLTLHPAAAEPGLLDSLQRLGLDAPALVTLAQLVAFENYAVRVAAGLRALDALGPAAATAAGAPPPAAPPPDLPGRNTLAAAPPGRGHFTLQPLEWRAWLPTVDAASANADQIAALDESNAAARVSPYYLTLVHNPGVLRQRSKLFNAIMYGPGGLPRAERELATVAVSRINGCPYCASVHARFFAQLTKEPEAVQRLLDEGVNAPLSPRRRGLVDLAVDLTAYPPPLGVERLRALRQLGLSDLELLDALHAAAIFAWANRLMQTLGEPVGFRSENSPQR